MNPKEHPAKSTSSKAALFATLLAPLRAKGASTLRGALLTASLTTALAVTSLLCVSVAPALAATPETPETGAAEPTSTTAVLHGTLNPHAPGQPGSYQFSYLPSATECVPGTLAPSFPTFADGLEMEAAETTVTGLEPGREYAFCLIAYSLLGAAEPSEPSPPVSFTTPAAAPSVDAESTSAVSSTAATLEAQVNPNNEATTYSFEYSTEQSGGVLQGPIVTVPAAPAGPLEGFGDQTASAPTETLLPNTTYFYRVLATNATGTTDGTVSETGFTTVATPTTQAATGVTATSATFNGTLTPLNETLPAEYSFDYNVGGECAGGSVTTPESAGVGSGAKAVSTAVSELQPGAEYSVCLVSQNASGSEVDPAPPQVFHTPAAAPIVTDEAASALTPFEATLEAQVNPDNQETTYLFEYATNPALTGAITLSGAAPLSGFGNQTASVATGRVLTPATTYHFRVVAENAAHEKAEGPVEEFTTPAATAPTIESESASAVTPEGATFEAQVNPEHQESTCSFEYATEQAKVEAGEGTTVACAKPLGDGGSPVGGSATVTGLELHKEYFYRALAKNPSGTTTDPTIEHIETEATVAPSLESEEASAITPTTATLNAKVNPNGAQITSCVFEYGTDAGYGHSAPCAHPDAAHLGAGREPVAVSVQLSGLEAAPTYHWRVTATSAAGTATSVDHTFALPSATPTTGDVNHAAGECPKTAEEGPGFSHLPDCRVYEQVTPTQKNGALIGAAFVVVQAEVAADGSRLMAVSLQCLPGAVSCVPNRLPNEGDPYAFERLGAGWVTRALAPPASELATDSWYIFNAEAGTALFSAPGPPLGQDNFYARSPDGTLADMGPLGESASVSNERIKPVEYEATADLSHVVYGSNNGPLWGFDETGNNHEGLYEYAGSGNAAPLLVGVTGGPGSHELIGKCGTNLAGFGGSAFNGTVSENGRIVFFEPKGKSGCLAPSPFVRELWERVDGERADAHSVLVSTPSAGVCTSVECVENTSQANEAERVREASFEAASDSGDRVVFTDAQQLTDAATESAESVPGHTNGNLYMSECPGLCPDPASERRLLDVSDPGVGATPVAGGPRVQGVMATSKDASSVYFVAQGVLTAQANQDGQTATDGEDNLYLYAGGHLTFIATLSPTDRQGEQWEQSFSANVSPDGRFLVFTDNTALTRDDTRPEADAEGAAQVYEYDADSRTLARVSVGQDGYNDNGNAGTGNAFIAEGGRGGSLTHTASIRHNPTMSEDGQRVFFQSPIALAPGALNDVPISSGVDAQNIYEWQAAGGAGCEQPAGCVYLISDGKDVTDKGYANSEYPEETPTGLIGTDRTGANVFFSTFDQLSPTDTDNERDFYDAHICSSGEPCTPPTQPTQPCAEGSCQGAGAPAQNLGAPASEVFSGAGNLTPPTPGPKGRPLSNAQKLARALKACHRKHGHRRRLCELTARKRYPTAHRPANAHRANTAGHATEATR